MKLFHEITVTDENGNDFPALVTGGEPGDEVQAAFAFIYGDNGFGSGNGVTVLTSLKKQPDGKYGA